MFDPIHFPGPIRSTTLLQGDAVLLRIGMDHVVQALEAYSRSAIGCSRICRFRVTHSISHHLLTYHLAW